MNWTWRVSTLAQLAVLFLTVPVALTQEANQISATTSAAPITVTLQDALTRAQSNEPQFHAALTDYGVARQQSVQARAALLPIPPLVPLLPLLPILPYFSSSFRPAPSESKFMIALNTRK